MDVFVKGVPKAKPLLEVKNVTDDGKEILVGQYTN